MYHVVAQISPIERWDGAHAKYYHQGSGQLAANILRVLQFGALDAELEQNGGNDWTRGGGATKWACMYTTV